MRVRSCCCCRRRFAGFGAAESAPAIIGRRHRQVAVVMVFWDYLWMMGLLYFYWSYWTVSVIHIRQSLHYDARPSSSSRSRVRKIRFSVSFPRRPWAWKLMYLFAPLWRWHWEEDEDGGRETSARSFGPWTLQFSKVCQEFVWLVISVNGIFLPPPSSCRCPRRGDLPRHSSRMNFSFFKSQSRVTRFTSPQGINTLTNGKIGKTSVDLNYQRAESK